jgi:hypothetical protein
MSQASRIDTTTLRSPSARRRRSPTFLDPATITERFYGLVLAGDCLDLPQTATTCHEPPGGFSDRQFSYHESGRRRLLGKPWRD